MDLAVLILAIFYLLGFGVGKALAICAIVYVCLMTIISITRKRGLDWVLFLCNKLDVWRLNQILTFPNSHIRTDSAYPENLTFFVKFSGVHSRGRVKFSYKLRAGNILCGFGCENLTIFVKFSRAAICT